MPPSTTTTTTIPIPTSAQDISDRPTPCGTRWRWSQRHGGDATAATTPAAISGATMAYVSGQQPNGPDQEERHAHQHPRSEAEVAQPARRAENTPQLRDVDLDVLLSGRRRSPPPSQRAGMAAP